MNATIENNQYTVDANSLIPYHGVVDQEKFEALVESMRVEGWVGAPLVKFDDCLLTGSHRYAAARELELNVPVVDLFDVFCVDEDEVTEIVESMGVWEIEVTRLAIEDNAALAEELGMDIQ